MIHLQKYKQKSKPPNYSWIILNKLHTSYSVYYETWKKKLQNRELKHTKIKKMNNTHDFPKLRLAK